MKRGKTYLKKIVLFKNNFFPKHNKGLSSIVITLILVVLSLVAIGVIWGVVSSLIKSSSKDVQIGSLMINLEITNAYEQDGNINVNLIRKTGQGEITKIKFILSDGGDSETITREVTTFEELDSQSFVLTPTQLIPSTIRTVSVASVFKTNEGIEKVGEITDTYTVNQNYEINPGENNNSSEEENPFCIPNCNDLQCGIDPLCGESCGTCETPSTCTNGVCVLPDCVPEYAEVTCEGIVCGTNINNCGAEISCTACPTGKICLANSCVDVTVLNSGIVEEVWPGTSGLYFGSDSLPIDIDYVGNYVKFSDSVETRCLLIVVYRFPVEGYPKSHIGFNFETLVTTGDQYKVFGTSEECQAA